MGGTFSLQKMRVESVGISGDRWSSINVSVLFANNGRSAIFFYSVIAFFCYCIHSYGIK